MKSAVSNFDRIFSRPRPVWVTLVASVVLLALPFAAAALDGVLSMMLRQETWRVFLLPPVLISYIWLVSPLLTRTGAQVISDLRPLIPLDDESYQQLVDVNSQVNPMHEWLVFGVGLVLGGLAAQASGMDLDAPWLRLYWYASNAMMYAVIAWTIFLAFSSTRLPRALHQQPLKVDLFDITPFEANGRQSLLLALVFIGGITLSLLLSFQVSSITALGFWLVYLGLVLVTVLIFFMTMRPTHQVLAAEKKHQLERVAKLLRRVSQEFLEQLENGTSSNSLPLEIQALATYEERLKATRTWPYNTAMLRTLFFSVFIPLLTVLIRLAVEIAFR